ncbi:MAG: nuclear transport factor 2 family protein [Bacteroidetes bacterium]|nr:nuclear transport factor 2 family protein [Bacteroidota bacterium]MBS1935235.1 nuclear transport factor 2 family protein [Bacteroidota bacterium]
MKKILFCFLLIITSIITFAQSVDEKAIQKLMQKQAAAWNSGNIDEFMKGYWQNDSLMFIGHGGITYGYKNTLDNYKKNYDSKEKMGTLFFSDVKMKKLSADYYFIVGKWLLKRIGGDIGGYYTLLFRKINGQWVIVCDHTS